VSDGLEHEAVEVVLPVIEAELTLLEEEGKLAGGTPLNFARRRLEKLQKLSMPLMWTPS
jgi:hypothetical protein